RLQAWSAQALDTLLASLKTDLDGLSDDEAHDRLVRHGANEVTHERPPHWAVQLVAAFRNPFILVLLILAGASLLTEPEERKGPIIISVMVAVSVVIRFVQEFRSTRAAEQLRAMVRTTATVVRRHPIALEISEQTARILGITHRQWKAERRDIPLQEVVPGDIVTLSAGGKWPADAPVTSAKDPFFRPALLSGA